MIDDHFLLEVVTVTAQAAQATSSDRLTPLFSSMNSNCETNHRGVSSF